MGPPNLWFNKETVIGDDREGRRSRKFGLSVLLLDRWLVDDAVVEPRRIRGSVSWAPPLALALVSPPIFQPDFSFDPKDEFLI